MCLLLILRAQKPLSCFVHAEQFVFKAWSCTAYHGWLLLIPLVQPKYHHLPNPCTDCLSYCKYSRTYHFSLLQLSIYNFLMEFFPTSDLILYLIHSWAAGSARVGCWWWYRSWSHCWVYRADWGTEWVYSIVPGENVREPGSARAKEKRGIGGDKVSGMRSHELWQQIMLGS